jgi:glutamate formiminotransferase/glutamate formiminotransferase/formiminotetrahydrofolate cyclodeaminase
MPSLLAVPNFSEGRDQPTIDALKAAVAPARLLDVHSDRDHNRTVLTLTAATGELAAAITRTAAAAIDRIDLRSQQGAHPRVGAIDVAPIVFQTPADRGAACAEALLLADRLGSELKLPVFLYGLLTDNTRTRSQIRRGGPAGLAARLADGQLRPDFGPLKLHPAAGGVLVGARPPLIAFNVELAPPATLEDAQRIAAAIREGGSQGLLGVRAIGVQLTNPDRPQVSINVEDYELTPLRAVIEAIEPHTTIARAELVGLPPRAALEGLPEQLELLNRRFLEDALAAATHPTTN